MYFNLIEGKKKYTKYSLIGGNAERMVGGPKTDRDSACTYYYRKEKKDKSDYAGHL